MNDLPVYLVISSGLKREQLTCFKQDILFSLLLAGLISLFISIRFVFGMGIPGKAILGAG